MKVMVVEDDAALREIYSIRIAAEGYEVVSAGDGEEALAVAVREKPDLILSDIMMPKISGFDMLDILRSTPETAKIKVIMMTALSGDDQRARGERLGANRYLVKSQVGIEDVVNAIHEELGDRPATTGTTPQPAAAPSATPEIQPSTSPAAAASVPNAAASTVSASVEQPTVSATAISAPASATPAPSTPTTKPAEEIPSAGQVFQVPNVPGAAQ